MSELNLTIYTAQLLRLKAKPGVLWTHFPAGELRNRKTGAKLKKMGLQPGWPDFLIIYGGSPYALELKDADGRLSIAQREFREDFRAQLLAYQVARTPEQVMEILTGWDVLDRRGLTPTTMGS